MSTGGGHHNARALLADAGKGVEVETGEILFICFGAILAVGMMIGVGCCVAYGAQHRRRKLTFPGAEDYVSHGRMNARKWIKTIGAPDMIAEQYDIAYAGGELPKDRYQRLALPMYADSGKKFDPCEMPKKWLKPLGPPLRKLYLCFFWNDICKVMYKDMYWGAKRLRDWNQETEADEETPARWLGECKPCCYAADSFNSCTNWMCCECCGMNECKTLQESTTNCVKSVGDPNCCVVEDGKFTGVPKMPSIPSCKVNNCGGCESCTVTCTKQPADQMVAPGEDASPEAHAAYEAYTERIAKETAETKAEIAKERAKKAIEAAAVKAQQEERYTNPDA